MGELRRRVSRKGQITIPASLRRQLGIKPNDQVTIRLEGDGLKVWPARSRLDDIYQSVPALARSLTDREVSDIAWNEHAAEIAR